MEVMDTVPHVQTQQGVLKGVVCGAVGKEYNAFKGIPYAKPPLGDLRFKAPEPPNSWTGVRDASEHGPVCPQYNERLDRIEEGSEDCLYLNVYSKNLTPKKPLPVIVWIHGGSFYTGSGDSDFYGPEFFMEHDVILVTFNYRLEVLGFLCLDNEDVPGNAGLKDQVAALRWVKSNIAVFGGDASNITISGCSAGSACTSYHLVSKMSKGLYDKAICQSGVCLNDWAYNLYARKNAFLLGKILGMETDDEKELLYFLKNVPVLSLINIKLPFTKFKNWDLADSLSFGPVIEKAELNVQKFVSEYPPDLVKSGQIANVPLIIGYTSGEGMELARKEYIAELISDIGDVVPRELKFKLTPENIQKADEKVRNFYFQGKDFTKEMKQEITNFATDTLFVYNIVRFARFRATQSSAPVFLYKFTAETERNYYKLNYKLDSVKGVCHADDLHYLFHVTCLSLPLTEDSLKIIKHFVKLWVDFARTGNPTPTAEFIQWSPFTETERNCFIIGDEFKCVPIQEAENIHFWDQLYEESVS